MRRIVAVVAVAGLSAVTFAAMGVPPAAAGGMTITVEKVVVGSPPPGTTFVVEIADDASCDPSGGTATYPFDAEGNFTGSNNPIFSIYGTCTPTEVQTGGATTVEYSCTGAQCASSGPSSTPIAVTGTFGEVTITVTNTFEPPPQEAPTAVVVAPRTTG